MLAFCKDFQNKTFSSRPLNALFICIHVFVVYVFSMLPNVSYIVCLIEYSVYIVLYKV